MAKINIKGLTAEIAKKGHNIIKANVEAKAQRAVQGVKQQLLNEFDNHPVTKEISGGPSSANSSNTLGGYGNLFTFIGFENGADPITPIRSLLAKSIQVKNVRKKNNQAMYILRFSVPTREEIEAVSPSPWSTQSWVDAVEKGMSGLGKFLYSKNQGRFSTSRSGSGVQAEFEIRSTQNSSAIDYVTGILNNMLKNIESNLKKL